MTEQSIWVNPSNSKIIQIIDQRALPYKLVIEDLKTLDDVCAAIQEMHVRGAPLIGVTAAYGVYLGLLEKQEQGTWTPESAREILETLTRTRPTAVNLKWAAERVCTHIQKLSSASEQMEAALAEANQICLEDIENCKKIGEHGVSIIRKIYEQKKAPVNILTHCNAGWLACVKWGTKTSPIYHAHAEGIPIHVWVDETRPRNQGARLTAWELGQRGIPHTVIVDNAGGHLMQHGKIDLVLVGSDRTTRRGDVCNKIGTYLKALAASANQVPFYVCLPSSTFDWTISDGLTEIPIEERDAEEVRRIEGELSGEVASVLLVPEDSPASNFGFDVTPNHLVTGLVTERGICEASEVSIFNLFPEKKSSLPLDEGVIKFKSDWIRADVVQDKNMKPLMAERNRLYEKTLIGVYENGIGYGNISVLAADQKSFIISGTQTGHVPMAKPTDFTAVLEWDIQRNYLQCRGPVMASSESLTHAMIYALDQNIQTVVHVHHRGLWHELLGKVPTTPKSVGYGTPEMAEAVKRLYKETDLRENKVLVMAGHEDGLISFGATLQEASENLIQKLK